MKRWIFVLLVLCVAFVGCQAKEAEARGGDPCKSFLGSVLNECIAEADVDDLRMEIGVGTDIKLWEHEKFTIDQESRIDLNGYGSIIDEGNYSTYTVFKPKMEKGLLQVVGDWISNLFNKE
jgi:hypothetical protein